VAEILIVDAPDLRHQRSACRTHLRSVLGRAADLRRNQLDRRPLRLVLGCMFKDQANRAFPQFG
jgi:hypothetical protein